MSAPHWERIFKEVRHEYTWLGHTVHVIRNTTRQRRDRWLALPQGGEIAKARPFAHLHEAEMWALHWLWRAGGSPTLPGSQLDPEPQRPPPQIAQRHPPC